MKEISVLISSLCRIVWYIYWAFPCFLKSFHSLRCDVMWWHVYSKRWLRNATAHKRRDTFILVVSCVPPLCSSSWEKQGLGWIFSLSRSININNFMCFSCETRFFLVSFWMLLAFFKSTQTAPSDLHRWAIIFIKLSSFPRPTRHSSRASCSSEPF